MSEFAGVQSFTIGSYNCRGYNNSKTNYINNLLSKCDMLLLQELWLSETQLEVLGNVNRDVLFTGVSGFDQSKLLTGRPYGGCAIMWRSNVLANVTPIAVDSKRICAVQISTDSWKIILINVYLPFEDSDVKSDEFVNLLALIEDFIAKYSDCHIVLAGDFNVDFSREWLHTAILNSFCDDLGLRPVDQHAQCNID